MAGITTRQETFGQALSKGGITLNNTSQQLVNVNNSRSVLEISNASDQDISIDFVNSGAVAGSGTILPAHSSAYWPTTGAVKVIGAGTGRVSYTEWG